MRFACCSWPAWRSAAMASCRSRRRRAKLLAPWGRFYMAEFHPFSVLLGLNCIEETAGDWRSGSAQSIERLNTSGLPHGYSAGTGRPNNSDARTRVPKPNDRSSGGVTPREMVYEMTTSRSISI